MKNIKNNTPQTPFPRPELSDSIRWWSFKGHFNKELYFRICSIKSAIR